MVLEIASSNLVFHPKCLGGEIGRHKGLKIPRTERFVPVRLRPEVQKRKIILNGDRVRLLSEMFE